MKEIYKVAPWAGILLIFCLISCKTAPAPEEPVAPAPAPAAPSPAAPPAVDPDLGPPDQALIDDLAAAKARVEASRAHAIDVESSRYFPEDWETVEDQYRSLKEPEPSTRGEFRAAVENYGAVADAFDDLAQKSLPLYAADRERELREAREAALKAGAEEISPDRLLMADAMAEKAADQYADGEYYPAAASASAALDMYKLMETGLKAYALRQEILDRDFVKYDPDNFGFTDELGLSALDSYDNGQLVDARDKAEQAVLWYAMLLDNGWETFAAGYGKAATDVQQAAYALKAHVAVKRDYDAALEVLRQGNSFFTGRQFPQAVSRYIQAESQFIAVRDEAQEKRRLAEEAIREAEETIARSDENARDAEIILEGDAL
jgi:hypothetical protein